MSNDLMLALIVAVVTGSVSTLTTVVALRVHIMYLRDGLKRVEHNTLRAHQRIDKIETTK